MENATTVIYVLACPEVESVGIGIALILCAVASGVCFAAALESCCNRRMLSSDRTLRLHWLIGSSGIVWGVVVVLFTNAMIRFATIPDDCPGSIVDLILILLPIAQMVATVLAIKLYSRPNRIVRDAAVSAKKNDPTAIWRHAVERDVQDTANEIYYSLTAEDVTIGTVHKLYDQPEWVVALYNAMDPHKFQMVSELLENEFDIRTTTADLNFVTTFHLIPREGEGPSA